MHTKVHKEVFQRSKHTLKDVVKAFSASRTFARGYAKTAEVDKALRKLSSKIALEDAEALSGHWDRELEGTVDYHALAVWLHAGADQDELVARFAHQLTLVSPRAVADGLEQAATRGGKITEKKFVGAMVAELGVVMSRCELRAVFAALDTEQVGPPGNAPLPLHLLTSRHTNPLLRSSGASLWSMHRRFKKVGPWH